MPHPAIRVLILQSNWLISDAIAAGLASGPFDIVYSGCNVEQAISAIATRGVDVALIHQTIGLGRNGRSGFADQIRTLDSTARIILILEEGDRHTVVQAFQAGAVGVLTVQSSLAQIADCVTWVNKGKVWASNIELEYLVSSLSHAPVTATKGTAVELLSVRERQVVDQLLAGLTNREIGSRLGLSEWTVRNHLYRIFDKLGVYSRVELALWMAAHTYDGQAAESIALMRA